MLKYIFIGSMLAGLIFTACNNGQNKESQGIGKAHSATDTQKKMDSVVYDTEDLIIRKISNHVYQHTSFLNTTDFGKVSCNGMVVVDENEAIVFDTPANEKSSDELITYLTKQMGYKINAVIATHFHADCVAGLDNFLEHNIPSYANNLTIDLARSANSPVPQNGFDQLREFKVGSNIVIVEFIGEGHTKDNIIGYYPAERIMFGGCLIKEADAGKGNLEDANVEDWPETVARLREKYPDVKTVIPGHGSEGGPELLDYTIQLFER